MRTTFESDGSTVHIKGEAEDGPWAGWTFTVRTTDAGPEEVAMRAPKGRAVTGRDWSKAPIGRVLALARHMLREPALVITLQSLAEEGVMPESKAYGADEHDRVAKVWRTALRHGASGPDAVAAVFQVSRRTAEDRLIPAARKAGALGAPPKPDLTWYRIGDRVVSRPRGGPSVDELAGPAITLERAWNAYLSEQTPALLESFSKIHPELVRAIAEQTPKDEQ